MYLSRCSRSCRGHAFLLRLSAGGSQIAFARADASPELALEVATAVLYVEALFSDLDLNDANSESRSIV